MNLVTASELALQLGKLSYYRRSENCQCVYSTDGTPCRKHLDAASELIGKMNMFGFVIVHKEATK